MRPYEGRVASPSIWVFKLPENLFLNLLFISFEILTCNKNITKQISKVTK